MIKNKVHRRALGSRGGEAARHRYKACRGHSLRLGYDRHHIGGARRHVHCDKVARTSNKANTIRSDGASRARDRRAIMCTKREGARQDWCCRRIRP